MVDIALQTFVSRIDRELSFAQVFICRRGAGFELRHVQDRRRDAAELKDSSPAQLRTLAQFTAAGAFRPLKSAPNLQTGWTVSLRNDAELEMALNHLYPGAIADWYAAQSPSPPVTNYREFTDRQTGMYRITQKLRDSEAAETIQACCNTSLCLKRRLWSIGGLETDPPVEKSLIPCLEPCALLLEFARKVMRIEQETKLRLELAPSEARTLAEALRELLGHSNSDVREADMSAPLNPRRIRRVLQKLDCQLGSGAVTEPEARESEG
ncbi:MAG: hypothetical protein HY735_29725 [Verrucomicrobia bacterium]|nr:hypothetical protein [Verrucomicrobiota bacterium]